MKIEPQKAIDMIYSHSDINIEKDLVYVIQVPENFVDNEK